MLPLSGGFTNLLKEGSRHFSGLEEAILKNIEACKHLSAITRTSLGPYGMNKMVVNNLEKLFVTTDAATIMKELDVTHPAAKLIVMAAKIQESQTGDGTNLVVILAGELLKLAEELIQTGLHPSQILQGFEKASKKVQQILPELVCLQASDLTDLSTVKKCLKPVIASKIYGYQDHISQIAAQACLVVTENQQKFDIENLRVIKLQGGGLSQSQMCRGLVLKRDSQGTIKHIQKARVAVYNCPLDPQHSDTKGTVLIKNAQQLKQYNAGQQNTAQTLVNSIADSGVNVVVVGGSIAQICMHFLELKEIMVIKVQSKFQLRRVARMLGATLIVRLGAPVAQEIGFADEISVDEISSNKVTVFKKEEDNCRLSTIVLRASTENVLDDAERALDDAFNTFRMMRKDKRFVPGAGACQAQLAKRLKDYGATNPGLDQYGILRYAQAFEVIPKTLAEICGQDSSEVLSQIYAEQNMNFGVNIEDEGIVDVSESVVDHLVTKQWAIKLASDVAITVLRVDQIIMAKPSGGPNPNKRPPNEEED